MIQATLADVTFFGFHKILINHSYPHRRLNSDGMVSFHLSMLRISRSNQIGATATTQPPWREVGPLPTKVCFRGGAPETGPPNSVHSPGDANPSGGPTRPGRPSRRHHRRSAAGGLCPVLLRPRGLDQVLPSGLPRGLGCLRPSSGPRTGAFRPRGLLHAGDQLLQGVDDRR